MTVNRTGTSLKELRRAYDVIVVGAGMGGLMAAALLARHGRKVLVLEASDKIGGFQRRFECENFLIDANFHFLQEAGPGRPIRELLTAAGVEPRFIALDPVAEFSFPDRVVRVPTDRGRYMRDLVALFPQEEDGIVALFDSMTQLYQSMQEWPAAALQTIASDKLPPQLAAVMTYANDTLDDYLGRFVASRELKAILGGWATYFGYCGSRIAALPVIVLSEACWDGGTHHPAGGIDSVTQSLKARIEAAAGTVMTMTPVRRILISKQQATGVELESGEIVTAPAIVANTDVVTTFHDLVGSALSPPGVIDAIDRMERFRSPLILYAGVSAEGLNLEGRAAVHVVFPGYDTDAGDDAQDEGRLADIAVSIGIPTLVTPELAPPGHHLLNIFSFVGTTLIDRLRDDESLKRTCIRQMIQAAERGIPGLSERLVMTRLSIDAYPDLYNKHTKGAIGWAPNMAAMITAPDQATAIDGLYLAGQWTNTGPAMNNVFRSSQRVAALILEGRANNAKLFEEAQ